MAKAAVGLDFGTSTTFVANHNGIVPIATAAGSFSMPSLVGCGEGDSLVVGEAAWDLAPERMVRSIKRSITDDRRSVRVETPHGLREADTDDLMVGILTEAIKRAEARGQKADDGRTIRIGCPAMWNGKQRKRLEAIARKAGLPVTLANFVEEPVAAGIAWIRGHDIDASVPLQVLVFDMGGGTLDIAVLEVRGFSQHEIAVLAAVGAPEAGDALDIALADDVAERLAAAGFDLNARPNPHQAWARLRDAIREVKIDLTFAEQVDIPLSKRVHGVATFPYTREDLNEAFEAQMDRADYYIAAALRTARLVKPNAGPAHKLTRMPISQLVAGVDVVVLSGGMSRIPYVAQRMRNLFPATTRIEMATGEPDQAVAIGLAHAAKFGRISMYRPAFDILLEWDHGQEFRVVYDAFTPLVAPGQIAAGISDLRYTVNGLDLTLPRQGTGRLRVVSQAGQRIHASLGGTDLDGFQVALSEQRFEFSIYPSGHIRMTDGAGTFDGQVNAWHLPNPV